MPIELLDSFVVNNAIPLDKTYGPYASVDAANTAIPSGTRYNGMLVSINNTSTGTTELYMYSGGTGYNSTFKSYTVPPTTLTKIAPQNSDVVVGSYSSSTNASNLSDNTIYINSSDGKAFYKNGDNLIQITAPQNSDVVIGSYLTTPSASDLSNNTIYINSSDGKTYYKGTDGSVKTTTVEQNKEVVIGSYLTTPSAADLSNNTIYINSSDGKTYYKGTDGSVKTTTVEQNNEVVVGSYSSTTNASDLSNNTIYINSSDGKAFYKDGSTIKEITAPQNTEVVVGSYSSLSNTNGLFNNTLYINDSDGTAFYKSGNNSTLTQITTPLKSEVEIGNYSASSQNLSDDTIYINSSDGKAYYKDGATIKPITAPVADATFNENITIDFPAGTEYTFGKYKNGQIIEAQGKTALEVIQDALNFYNLPTSSISISESNTSNILKFSDESIYTFTPSINLSYSTVEADTTISSTTLTRDYSGNIIGIGLSQLTGVSSNTTNFSDGFAINQPFNTQNVKYTYTITDNNGKVVTKQITISPQTYRGITFSDFKVDSSSSVTLNKEIGRYTALTTGPLSITCSSISTNQQFNSIKLKSYKISRTVSGITTDISSNTLSGSIYNVGPLSFTDEQTITSSTSVIYSISAVDSYTNDDALRNTFIGTRSITVNYTYKIYYGVYTTGDPTTASFTQSILTGLIGANSIFEGTNSITFTVSSGVTGFIVIALPPGYSLTSITDNTAMQTYNISGNKRSPVAISINNNVTKTDYSLYYMSLGAGFTSPHSFTFTPVKV